jgi:hypothetical protein
MVTCAVTWIKYCRHTYLLGNGYKKSLLIYVLNNHTSKEQVEKINKYCTSLLYSSVWPYSEPNTGCFENAGVTEYTVNHCT